MENKKYEYKAKYAKENYEHLNIYAPKGYRASIEKCMAQLDMSMNAFVISAIYEKMARCGLTDEEIGNGEPVKKRPRSYSTKSYYIVDDCTSSAGVKWVDELTAQTEESAIRQAEKQWDSMLLFDKEKRDGFELILAEREDFKKGGSTTIYDRAKIIRKFK